MEASFVFIESFKRIKIMVFNDIKQHAKTKCDVEINNIYDIQWIVTVPAIWDENAKNKMITWIEKAGLINENITDHCLIKYEPDCASLSLQHEILNKQINVNDSNLFDDAKDDIKQDINGLIGKKYIIIDAGGGTVDIGCHEFMENCSVKEIYYPTGGPWGDTYIDKAFENTLRFLVGFVYAKKEQIKITTKLVDLLSDYFDENVTISDLLNGVLGNDIVSNMDNLTQKLYENALNVHGIFKDIEIIYILYGINILEKLNRVDQSIFVDLLANFRATKNIFCDKNCESQISVDLPDEFIAAIGSELGYGTFQNMILHCVLNGYKNCFSIQNNCLNINSNVFKEYLFDPLINKVTDCVKDLLSKDIIKDCSYIYLVGGYSKTPYFQNIIIETFGLNSKYNIDVVIPSKPLLSVVDGAARMGLLKNIKREYVKIRILSKTYGHIISKPFTNINLKNYSKTFIQQNRYAKSNGSVYLSNCFQIFARKGDSIGFNHKIKHVLSRSNKFQNSSLIKIHSSDETDPKTIYDGNELAQSKIIWPPNNNDLDVTIEITFGEMIKVVSYPTNTPQLKLETRVDYN